MKYYLNDDVRDDGYRIVHAEECQFLPNEGNRTALGDHGDCDGAMAAARDEADKVNGCHTCCPDCHQG